MILKHHHQRQQQQQLRSESEMILDIEKKHENSYHENDDYDGDG